MQRYKNTIKKCFAFAVSGFFLVAVTFSTPLFAVEEPVKKLPKTLTGGGMSDPNMAGNLVQTTLGLLVVLLVIGAAAWAFKRFGSVHVGAQGRMKIIGGISLGTRERAVLLQVGEQQLVVGVTPGRVQTLHVLDTPVAVDDKAPEATSFSARLQSAISNRKNDTHGGGQQ
jgi:flagellar protein FliO/FliZ